MMKSIMEHGNCSGCGACSFICPHGAVTMSADDEGFAIPVIAEEQCTDCGACRDICPAAHAEDLKERTAPSFYAAKHTDGDVLFRSTSGGAFTGLSDAVLAENGTVYGVVFDDHLDVCHARTETAAGRDAMRFSKYVQSRLEKDIYEKIKADLDSGRLVMFTGTPCQTAAVRSVFGRPENLILVDLVCFGAPSPRSWTDYKKTLEEEQGSPLVFASFRSKEKGWFRGQYQVYYKVAGKEERLEDTRFFEMFFRKRYLLRPSCYSCPYTDRHRTADLTIADYWGIEKFSEEWCDRRGVSLILVNTQAGEALLKRSRNLLFEQRDPQEALSQQKKLSAPAEEPADRAQFWNVYRKYGFAEAAREFGDH
ncbi:MAG: Coenzyme F420 hydrogenase/dehydrogenase, beta subunit C-terminal domain [Lachnospiraceae bacterium]|nr:Coenzyme F420 hydrogenase/dehydrogenase, beta subunit C-terminal domain [Lachnospiraceae bacterium]